MVSRKSRREADTVKIKENIRVGTEDVLFFLKVLLKVDSVTEQTSGCNCLVDGKQMRILWFCCVLFEPNFPNFSGNLNNSLACRSQNHEEFSTLNHDLASYTVTF